MKGRGKKSQGPKQKTFKKGEKKEQSAAVADDKDQQFFAFTCTLDYVAIAEAQTCCLLGFSMRNPQVRKSHTVPIPAVTAPMMGVGTHHTHLATV